VAVGEKLKLLDRAFKGRLSPLLINLLHLLATRRRTTYLDETLTLFQELVERAEGISQASVSSAGELSFQDKLRLKAALEKYTKSRLKIEYLVEPGLIGGVIFRFRDLLVDGSLASALEELRERMLSRTLVRESV
jgi:F-type H+-transporting ATPase subunit delta